MKSHITRFFMYVRRVSGRQWWLGGGAMIVLALGSFGLAAAQDALTDTHLENIRQNCITAQVTMQRVQQSDIAMRINYGRAYDSLATQLMAPLNSRAVVAQVDISPTLSEQANAFTAKVNDFRNNYADYTKTLTKAIRTDCQNKPAEFYEAVLTAREQRKRLTTDIKAINATVKNYETIVADYTKQLREESAQ